MARASKYSAKCLGRFAVLMLCAVFVASCSSDVRFSSGRGSSGSNGSSGSRYEKPAKKSKSSAGSIEIPEDISELRQDVVRTAAEWIGTPYCSGGESRDCADCSGFIMSVFSVSGVQLPRTAEEQYEASTRVKRSALEPGDLVFFKDKKKVSHVGLYVGSSRFIHASSSKGVMSSSLDDAYFSQRFCSGGRVL